MMNLVQFQKKYFWQIPFALMYALIFLEIFLRVLGGRWFYDFDHEYLNPPYKFVLTSADAEDMENIDNYRLIKGKNKKLVSITKDGLRWPDQNNEPVVYLTLGSSSTFAGELDDKKAWPYLTAKKINQKLGRQHVWFANAGYPGMNTVHNIIHLRYLAKKFNVTGVVLNVGLNDANYFADHGEIPHLKNDSDSDLKTKYAEAFPLPSINRLIQMEGDSPWYKKMYSYQFLLEFKLQMVEQKLITLIGKIFPERSLQAKKQALLSNPNLNELKKNAQEDYKQTFRQLIREAKTLGLEVVVVSMPEIEGDLILYAINEAIRNVCAQEDAIFFDTALYLADYPKEIKEEWSPTQVDKFLKEKKYLYHDGHHFNNKGSEWISEKLAAYLLKQSPLLKAFQQEQETKN